MKPDFYEALQKGQWTFFSLQKPGGIPILSKATNQAFCLQGLLFDHGHPAWTVTLWILSQLPDSMQVPVTGYVLRECEWTHTCAFM